MADTPLQPVLTHLRRLAGADAADQHLVERFAAARDEAAFEVLVRRHGPMVLGVCRRLLVDPADVDDAFQATFLVLVRKARTLADPGRVGAWLHGVACRTAREARSRRAWRATRERQVDALPERPATVSADNERRGLVDEEVGRLPEKYRVAVVLCELQGHSREQAAQLLGVPEGTLSSRLARARDLLRDRLTRRGVTLAVGAAALVPEAAPAVESARVAATAQAGLAFVDSGAGAALPSVLLAEKVLQGMTTLRTKLVVALAVLVICAAGGLGYAAVAGHPVPAAEDPPALAPAVRQETKAPPQVAQEKPAVETEEQKAAAALKELGANVYFENDDPSRNVVEVNMGGADLTAGRVLHHLARFPKLRALRMQGVKADDDSLAHLSGLTQLEVLIMDSPELTAKGLEHLRGLTRMRELTLNYINFGDAGARHLEGMKQLETLRLYKTGLTDAALESVAKLPALKFLDVGANSLTADGLRRLKALQHLETLYAGSSPTLGDDALAVVAEFPALHTLELHSTQITAAGIRHLRRATKLRTLYVGFNKLGDKAAQELGKLTELRSLDLSGTLVTDDGLAHLQGLKELRELRLTQNKIFNAGLAHLKALPRLEELALNSTPISDPGLKHLYGLKSLKSLWLIDTEVTEQGVADLRKALPNLGVQRFSPYGPRRLVD
jgi:RNA polymerase sigma factor (sigma-70 family)